MTRKNPFDFGASVDDGDKCSATVLHNGRRFQVTATVHRDDDSGAPWDREDGHGPVSDWRRNVGAETSKRPGELRLSSDCGASRFYDFAEACKIARRDGWGTPGDEGLSPRAKAAKAARADFERLRDWCADRWAYVGVAVTVERAGVQLVDKYAHALWGIESDSGAYVAQVAGELLGEALEAAGAKLSQLVAA